MFTWAYCCLVFSPVSHWVPYDGNGSLKKCTSPFNFGRQQPVSPLSITIYDKTTDSCEHAVTLSLMLHMTWRMTYYDRTTGSCGHTITSSLMLHMTWRITYYDRTTGSCGCAITSSLMLQTLIPTPTPFISAWCRRKPRQRCGEISMASCRAARGGIR